MGKGTVYHALDISAGTLTAVMAVVNKAGKIIKIQCRSGVSAGVTQGRVTDVGALSDCVAAVMEALSAATGVRIKSFYVAMHSQQIKATHSLCTIPLSERANKIITSGDVAKVNQQAYSLGFTIEEQILYQAPQEYTIDNQNRVLEPAGLYGHKLGADLLLVTALSRDIQNIVSAVDRAGYKIRAVVASGVATSLAVVSDEAKKKGCCLLDIGFDMSQMLIFKDGILRGYESFNFGSRHITEAIAAELKLPQALAEEVKASHGCALASHVSPEQEVLIKKEQGYRPIKRKAIASIIENRLQEFFTQIKESFVSYRGAFEFPAGVVVNGKEALLEGFIESLEHALGAPTHIATIEDVSAGDLSYSAGIGLVKYAVLSHPQINLFKLSSYGNMYQKIIQKVKELYHEYF
ncbi:MAG: cell division protein FtsA [Omnitrophica WOR_2 bacterium GWF2_43_52]|nr:MAG: cell division protein FtsA [Omnitrophica WOR_2 bacterium GWA2_44_7]OGX20917.1 MAG: cell division protein FtsA [Omnitrophica WOR_2 bacterium GWF2_43_52]OGX57080.1 MAG: cell division protein FtsA [Omnitrophica WOR_2 bacterium RIFOXYC2_FULL_43_9]HAH21093.1 cell division protein FtsA [Candidatus Omnitrophota bacterium]HBG63305.1 cell division protein FtsA [Candidatus Omnitrophota bacterium]